MRVAPATTQFSLTNKEQDAIKFYSPDAVLTQDDTASNLYKVSGTVELMFNYAKGTDAEKAWVDGITDVDLVSANENNTNLNIELNWQLNKEYQHGTGTVACITVPLGQSNFYSNGRYQLRVTSNGTSKLFPIHVVNETKPSMILTDTTAKSGQNVHFRVENMTYGITQPIYRVELTTPDNTTTELTKIDDWYLIGDSFILYNDTTDHIPTVGQYTLTIYADGFKPFTKEFNVTSGQSLQIQKAALPYGVDTYSGSSVSGGGASSGSGSEGGSNTMNAYLVFQADLLVNAEIMTDLGTGNAYAEAIATRWNELTPISVYAKGSTDTYDAPHFFDTLNKRNQDPMTFAAYVTSDQAVKYTRGTPYAVKQVLEDNLLGETTAFSETANKAVPDITLVKLVDDKYVAATEVTEGQDAMFQCLDKAYLEKLAESGSIYKGTASYQPFASTDYSVDTKKGILIISKEKLTVGDNSITIQVNGYQTVRLSVPYQKVLEAVKLSAPTEAVALGNPVTITCNAEDHKDGICDFFANVTSVELTGPDEKTKTVLLKGQESTSKDNGYSVNGTAFTLGKDLFEDKWSENPVGEYTLTINSGYGYAPQMVKFNIKAKDVVPEPEEATPPTVAGVELVNGYDSYYRVSFSGDAKAYLNKVTGATVDGTVCEITSMFLREKQMKIFKDNGVATYIDFTTDCFSASGETTVVIQATGYTDLTFKVKDGKLVTDGDSSKLSPPAVSGAQKVAAQIMNQAYTRISFTGDENTVATYLALIETNHITVNGEAIGKTSSFWNSTKEFKLSNDPTYGGKSIYLDITEDSFSASGNSTVVISVDGYNDLTVTIDAQGNLVTE